MNYIVKNTTKKIYLFVLIIIISLMSPFTFAQQVKINECREMVLNNQIGKAIEKYSFLVEKSSTNAALLAEYSFVLALAGAFDCALMNLDRVRLFSLNSPDYTFYSSLVFGLMSYDNLSSEFAKITYDKKKKPQWISDNQYLDLLKKHKKNPALDRDDYLTSFVRANYLAYNGLYLQAIALYEEITKEYITEYLPHVGYSIVLEKAGLYQKAVDELNVAIKMMGDTPEEIRAKKVFEKRKVEVEDRINSPKKFKNWLFKQKTEFNPQMMLYAGGMVTTSSIAFNARYGMFLTNTFNGAVDVGISGAFSGSVNANLGISGYQRFFNFLVLGEGINLQIGKSTIFSLKTTVGLSFINKKQNSSWDIFFDLYLPISNGIKLSYGASVGKSFYFGKRKYKEK